MREDVLKGVPVSEISRRFHSGLVRLFTDVCRRLRTQTGINVAALSGGCFQNRFLSENLHRTLAATGFDVLMHAHVPCNDGGLALGQAAVASYQMRERFTWIR